MSERQKKAQSNKPGANDQRNKQDPASPGFDKKLDGPNRPST